MFAHDEKFLIIIGGNRRYKEPSDIIYVCDMETGTWGKSSIKCPNKASYTAVVLDKYGAGLLEAGYVKELDKQFAESGTNTPWYLIDIIIRYNEEDVVHIFENDSTNHWSIPANKLINSTTFDISVKY